MTRYHGPRTCATKTDGEFLHGFQSSFSNSFVIFDFFGLAFLFRSSADATTKGGGHHYDRASAGGAPADPLTPAPVPGGGYTGATACHGSFESKELVYFRFPVQDEDYCAGCA